MQIALETIYGVQSITNYEGDEVDLADGDCNTSTFINGDYIKFPFDQKFKPTIFFFCNSTCMGILFSLHMWEWLIAIVMTSVV